MIETLGSLQRLALSYAPSSSRLPLLALFALDNRLAGIVRNSHEPMLAQLRLTWWREQLTNPPGGRALGDPLLAVLADWPGDCAPLAGLVDGWEGMTGAPPLSASVFVTLAEARGAAFALLAQPSAKPSALRMGRNWALVDIAMHLSHPAERRSALDLARLQNWQRDSLPRTLRPLAILHGLAARAIWSDVPQRSLTPRALLLAMRIGLLGR